MSKVHLLSKIIEDLKVSPTQESKLEILQQYNKELILRRIISISYNPWLDLGMPDFNPKRMGKKFGMGIAKFTHIIDDIIQKKYSDKEKYFSCNMAMQHINQYDAPIFVEVIRQTLDLGLEVDTINKVWPGLIMSYPISMPSTDDYKTFNKFPAAVQPISKGLRVNIIIDENKVTYKDKVGQDILGWEIYDEQFLNLAQGNSTVYDGHAVVANGTEISETDNEKVLEADPENIRFILWDVIRYDGFIEGRDTRMGYNWRYNGLEHMCILAVDKNKQPCYSVSKAELVGSLEQLELTISKLGKCVIKSLEGTWKHGIDDTQIIYE